MKPNILYWFLNDTFLGKASRNHPFYWHAKQGKFIIHVVDDHGRADSQEVKVKQEI